MNQKCLDFVKNGPNYKALKIGISSGNLTNFGGCNLARNSLFQVFFVAFFMLA